MNLAQNPSNGNYHGIGFVWDSRLAECRNEASFDRLLHQLGWDLNVQAQELL
jgi:hypothetical protein